MNVQPKAMLQLPVISLRPAALIFALLCAAVAAAYAMTPRLVSIENAPSLEDEVPRQFGDWKEIPSPYVQVPLTAGLDPNMDQPYDQVVTRTYMNAQGKRVMLALAWGKKQRQEVKIHRPDLCYIAQGFKITELKSASFEKISANSKTPINGKHMLAKDSLGGEAVSYWMRIGNQFSEDAFQTRKHIFNQGIQGRIPDGILVRASLRISSEGEASDAWKLLDEFLSSMNQAAKPGAQQLFIGHQVAD